MSVTSTVTFPGQPADGITHVQPLGGNGFHSPKSSVYCEASQAGDATGGVNQITFEFDSDHMTMVHWIGIRQNGASADSQGLVNHIFDTPADMNLLTVVPLAFDGGLSGGSYGMYRPPPIVAPPKPNPPSCVVSVPNVNLETLFVHFYAFEFNPNAAQVTPFPYLSSNFAS